MQIESDSVGNMAPCPGWQDIGGATSRIRERKSSVKGGIQVHIFPFVNKGNFHICFRFFKNVLFKIIGRMYEMVQSENYLHGTNVNLNAVLAFTHSYLLYSFGINKEEIRVCKSLYMNQLDLV